MVLCLDFGIVGVKMAPLLGFLCVICVVIQYCCSFVHMCCNFVQDESHSSVDDNDTDWNTDDEIDNFTLLPSSGVIHPCPQANVLSWEVNLFALFNWL